MKKINFKKYPLLICVIVSAVILVASLFVIGFAGIKFDSTIAGGSQVEVILSDNADAQEYSNDARIICKKLGFTLYSTKVEDKYVAGENNGEFTSRVLLLTIAQKNVSEEKQLEFRQKLAEKLGNVDIEIISDFEETTNMTLSKNIWLVLLSVGIVAFCLFIFATIRYDVFAGASMVISIIHNIILYFAVASIIRLPIGLASIALIVVMTFIESIAFVSILEKYRKVANLHIDDKLSTAQRLINAQLSALVPYMFVGTAVLVSALILLLSPAFIVKLISFNLILILLVSTYTLLLVSPAVYAYLTDLSKARENARLSRNENVNKLLKKKVKNSK